MIPASTLPGTELLDDLAADAAQVRCSLHSIARANRWLGGLAAARYGLRRALGGGACYAHRLTLLDVGTGLGDLPRALAAWAKRRGIHLAVMGLDRHPVAARLAYAGGLPTVLGSGGTLPVRSRSVDLVLVSQVAHHLPPEAVRQLVRECTRVARAAVILADLRRSSLAQLGFALAGKALRFDPATRRDGITSLRRGFTAEGLARLLAEAGVTAPVVRRPGFRLVAVWRGGAAN